MFRKNWYFSIAARTAECVRNKTRAPGPLDLVRQSHLSLDGGAFL